MFNLLAKHSFVVILIAVFLEEMGIPMPIPTDILIVFAGVEGAGMPLRLALWFGVLNLASAIGATVLYAVVRRGGRPLVERFGRYVHLGPEQLARGERLLQRSGWTGIAVGRAIPGLRYVTVIACGLLNIPYYRFITAHIVGSSVYITVFLFLGAHFGPAVVEQIHAPEQTLRLAWLLTLAVGLPLLMMWLYYRGHAHRPGEPSRWRVVSAIFIASFFGATSLAATWSTAADVAHLMNPGRQLNITMALIGWLQGRGLAVVSAYTLFYVVLLLLCIGIGVAYYDFVLPFLAPRGASMPKQVLGLAAMALGLVACFLVPSLLFPHPGPVNRWWQDGGYLFLLIIGLGIASYALTTVYGRALAIAILPSLWRNGASKTASATDGSVQVMLEKSASENGKTELATSNGAATQNTLPIATDSEQA